MTNKWSTKKLLIESITFFEDPLFILLVTIKNMQNKNEYLGISTLFSDRP